MDTVPDPGSGVKLFANPYVSAVWIFKSKF